MIFEVVGHCTCGITSHGLPLVRKLVVCGLRIVWFISEHPLQERTALNPPTTPKGQELVHVKEVARVR